MMVHVGHADGMVSGAAHTTRHTLRPALEFIRTRQGSDLVSSALFLCRPDRVLVYADCTVNPSPTPVELADIASTTADTAAAFGLTPRVAMVSYDPGFSALGADIDKVAEATKIARERRRDVPIEGPMPYDVAVDADAAAASTPDSVVAGAATVLIFPDLHTGTETWGRVQRATGAVAMGPVLQGLARPVNDLSRRCTVSDVVRLVAMTAIQAQQTTPDVEE
jgi:phosphate acetyltransferase